MPTETLWQEREVFENKGKNTIEEWQSARCPYCQKYHTTPYMYYFDDYNFCPNCGAMVSFDNAVCNRFPKAAVIKYNKRAGDKQESH